MTACNKRSRRMALQGKGNPKRVTEVLISSKRRSVATVRRGHAARTDHPTARSKLRASLTVSTLDPGTYS